MSELKQIRLKVRDAKNKITGKQGIIDEYNSLTQEIAESSDNEKNADRKKGFQTLYQEVTDEKWETNENGSITISDHNPYKEKKKDTKKKIEIAQQGLAKMRDGR